MEKKKEMIKKMPKAISIPPPVNAIDIPPEGIKVQIKDLRFVTDQWTSIGTCKKGLALTVTYKDKEYSQLFSLDKAVFTGSIGRILVSIGIDDTDTPDFDEKIKALIGKEIQVAKRGGKLYWYP